MIRAKIRKKGKQNIYEMKSQTIAKSPMSYSNDINFFVFLIDAYQFLGWYFTCTHNDDDENNKTLRNIKSPFLCTNKKKIWKIPIFLFM